MIKVVNMQGLIQPKEYSPLEKINNCKNKGLYEIIVSLENIELVVISDYLYAIKNDAIIKAIIHITNEYLMRMNILQYAYEKNCLKEFIKELTDESLEEYIGYFNETKALVTEKGREVQAKLIEEQNKRNKYKNYRIWKEVRKWIKS